MCEINRPRRHSGVYAMYYTLRKGALRGPQTSSEKGPTRGPNHLHFGAGGVLILLGGPIPGAWSAAYIQDLGGGVHTCPERQSCSAASRGALLY